MKPPKYDQKQSACSVRHEDEYATELLSNGPLSLSRKHH